MKKSKVQLLPAERVPDESREVTKLFLREGMGLEDETTSVYNLYREFSASKKNRSYPVYIVVILFAIILLSATVLLTRGIQRDIDRISVGISDFRDLNLAELLNAFRKAEMELKDVDDKISVTRQAMELEVERIKRATALEIKKVEESGLGQAEKQRLIKKIQADNDTKMKVSSGTYEDRIKSYQLEADNTRSRMESLKKQVAVEKTDYVKAMENKVKYQEESSSKQLEDQRREYQQALASYQKELDASRDETVKESEKTRSTAQLLNLYKQALRYYAKTRGEHGYVIDPGSKGNMLLDINPYIAITPGDKAYILTMDNSVLALVELRPEGIRMKAKILKKMLNDEIHPFDKILVIKN